MSPDTDETWGAEADVDGPADGVDNGYAEDGETVPGGHDALMKFIKSANIAVDLTDDQLGNIGDRVTREYNIDKDSRAEWEVQIDKALDLALQKPEAKNTPWPNASNVKFPLMTSAAIQFAARAYPAIVPGGNIVKCKVVGSDSQPKEPQQDPGMAPQGQPGMGQMPGAQLMGPQHPGMMLQGQGQRDGEKRARAGRISRHMSYQLSEEMEEWDEDTDRLLHVLPIVGCLFRKTWFDPGLRRNVSLMVLPTDLVVHYSTKSLETAPRITQEIELHPHEITEKIRSGLWRNEELGRPADADANDDDAPHSFLEQHRLLDLDDDGYPEPYIVTVHKETSKVMRIVARYDESGILVNPKGEVTRIEPIQYFVKYGFIPSPDGGFYDVGFGVLLNPINAAVNTVINQMLDAGTLQNTGGGFIGGGLKIKGGNLRLRLGEYKVVDAPGTTVAQNVVPLQHPGPSPVLFQLLGLLVDAGREIASIKDILTGEAPKNQPAATTMAMIEQGMKVFTAIYKRIHRSLKRELKMLYRLNRIYMDPEVYFTVLDEPEAIAQADYEDKSMDVIPVSDPNVVTDMQKMARAQFVGEFKDDPWIDGREARRRMFDAASIEDVDTLLLDKLPEDPRLVMDVADQEIKQADIHLKEADQELNRVKTDITGANQELKERQQELKEKQAEIAELVAADEMANKTRLTVAQIEKIQAETDKIEAETKEVGHAEPVY